MRMSRLQGVIGGRAKEYLLTISQGANSTITVNRIASSAGHGSLGIIGNGEPIYHGDVLEITIAANSGYYINVHTVNEQTWDSGVITVSGDISIVSSAWYLLLNYSSSVAWTARAWGTDTTDCIAPGLSGTTERTVTAPKRENDGTGRWTSPQGCVTTGAINLTNYHKLRMTVSSRGSNVTWTLFAGTVSSNVVKFAKSVNISSAATVELDVSSLSGSYYVGVYYKNTNSTSSVAMKYKNVELR